MDPRRLRIALLAGLLSAAPRLAHAGAVTDLVQAAREALQSEEYDDARRFTRRAEKVADNADDIIPYRTQARIWYYQGLAEWYGGDRDTKALEAWREALKVDIDFPWDVDTFPEEDAESVFESLRREVRSRSTVDLGVPDQTGQAELYVAGRQVRSGDSLPQGRYLVQARCPNGDIYSRWWKYDDKTPEYEELCPEGFGEIVEDATAGDDDELMFDEFGNPIVGGAPSKDSLISDIGGEGVSEPEDSSSAETDGGETSPDPTESEEPAPEATADAGGEPAETEPAETESTEGGDTEPETPAVAEADPKPASEEPAPDPDESSGSGRAVPPSGGGGSGFSGNALLYGGAGACAVGVGMNFLLVNPAWSDVEQAREAPEDYERAEADELTAKFNRRRWLTLATLGVGLAGMGGGVLLGDTGLVFYPGGVTWQGRF